MQTITNVTELAMGLVAIVLVTNILIAAGVGLIVGCDNRRPIESHGHVAEEIVRGERRDD